MVFDQKVLADVDEMLETARKLCRQAGNALERQGMIGWAAEPYDWATEIDDYLLIFEQRMER